MFRYIVASVLGLVLATLAVVNGLLWLGESGGRSQCSNAFVGAVSSTSCARIASISNWCAVIAILATSFSVLFFVRVHKISKELDNAG